MKTRKNCPKSLKSSKKSLKYLKYAVPIWWIFLVFTLPIGLGASMLGSSVPATSRPRFVSFASKPLLSGSKGESVSITDARVEKIDRILEKYKCPLAGKGKYFVETADRYNVPYWLVASIAFQESSCGKNTPKPAGVGESYNAWGWGVWGTRIKTFDSWENGIDAVTKYLAVNFFEKGVQEPCEIMNVYTPSSNGSWCSGVQYFGDMIQTFETT
jgi:hypothetical protein